MSGKVLSRDFYVRSDVSSIARELLGKVLSSAVDGVITSGIIVETEAYSGTNDLACHACRFGKTSRTEVMFREGGVAYVYLCYGIHHMVNVVTNEAGNADAVLIRALQPLDGLEQMQKRRKKKSGIRITAGPGTVGEALAIKAGMSGASLLAPPIWIEDRGIEVPASDVTSAVRIGVDYAGEDAMKPWRYYINDNPFVSKK